jgi:hypothetical protein
MPCVWGREPGRADAELSSQLLRQGVAVDEQGTSVRRNPADQHAAGAAPDIMPGFQNGEVKIEISQEVGCGDAGWPGADDDQVMHVCLLH